MIKKIVAGIIITSCIGAGGAVVTHGKAIPKTMGNYTFNTKTLKMVSQNKNVEGNEFYYHNITTPPQGGTWNYGVDPMYAYSYYYNNDAHGSTSESSFGYDYSGLVPANTTSDSACAPSQPGTNILEYNNN